MRSIVHIGIILLIICLAGCGNNRTAGSAERIEEMNGSETGNGNTAGELTEQQLQILRDCGLSEEQIQEIQEKGMSASQKSFVDVAEIVLNKLEDKYGLSFSILGGTIPDLLSSDYTFTVCAAEGEYALIPFEVIYEVDEEGKGLCREGYFAVLKNQEMQEYMQNIADEEGIGIRVITHTIGVVGDAYAEDSSLEDMRGKNTGIEVEIYGLVMPEVDETSFMNMCETLADRYRGTGYRLGYDVYRLTDSGQYDEIASYADLKQVYPQGMRENDVYDIKYHEYIIPVTE